MYPAVEPIFTPIIVCCFVSVVIIVIFVLAFLAFLGVLAVSAVLCVPAVLTVLTVPGVLCVLAVPGVLAVLCVSISRVCIVTLAKPVSRLNLMQSYNTFLVCTNNSAIIPADFQSSVRNCPIPHLCRTHHQLLSHFSLFC